MCGVNVRSHSRPCLSPLLQALIVLACVGAAGLCLSTLLLTVYLSCMCCCRRGEDEQVKRPSTCCLTWVAVIAGLIVWWVPGAPG